MEYYITVEESISGWHAVLIGPEGPEITGVGKYDTAEQAANEAIHWSESDEIPVSQRVKDLLKVNKQ